MQYLGVQEAKITIENALNRDTLRVKVTINRIIKEKSVLGASANSELAS